MDVTLAYAYGDHEPDETISLPDGEAQRLINDGRARKAKATPAVVQRQAVHTTDTEEI